VKNLLSSTIPISVPSFVNAVFYHQEFDTDVFKYKEPSPNKRIASFLNGFNNYPDANLFYALEEKLGDWEFKIFGAENRDGSIAGYKKITKEIHDSRFVWQVKAGGDGFGHIIHNAFACGRPPIVKMEYYEGQLASKLMKDMKTCVAIDNLTVNQIINKLNSVSNYGEMCLNASKAFREQVDYDSEETRIREFMERLN
jgi:hypothetical protein